MEKIIYVLFLISVRSFVLSNLKNIQNTDAPYMRGLRYNISSLVIPRDYEQDFRLYSRSSELSYYMPSLGLGAGIDSSMIYVPGSYIPRQWQANFTTNLFDNVINIGEIALRLEDIESIYEIFVGPNGYLSSLASKEAMMKDLKDLFSGKGGQIMEHLSRKMKESEGGKLDLSNLLNAFKSNIGDKQPRLDILTRIFGKEVFFSTLAGQLKTVDTDRLLEELMEIFVSMIYKASKFDLKFLRGAQTNVELFVPTQQGIPLQGKFVFSLVSLFQIKGDASLAETHLFFNPQFSLAINGFVGYTMGAKAGIRSRTNSYLKLEQRATAEIFSDKAKFILDGPGKMMDNTIVTNTYVMFKLPSEKDQILGPRSGYPTFNSHECMAVVVGSSCYTLVGPDPSKTNMLPMGKIESHNWVQKDKDSAPYAIMELIWIKAPTRKNAIVKLELPGSSNPKAGSFEIDYVTSPSLKSLFLYVQGSTMEKSLKVDVESKSTSHGKKFDVTLFAGNQKSLSGSHKVLTAVVGGGMNGEQAQGEFILKTQNQLERYIKADIESKHSFFNTIGVFLIFSFS